MTGYDPNGGAPFDPNPAGSTPEPGHPQPGYDQPGYGQPGHGGPGYSGSGYGGPGYGEQQYQPIPPASTLDPTFYGTGIPPAPPPSYLPPPSNRGRLWVFGAAAAVVVLVAAGGAAFAYNALSGGGTQPEDVLPATSVGFAKVDLDPAANQKLALYELSRKFPGQNHLIPNEDSLKDGVLAQLLSGADTGLDYDRDVKPWIGDRLAIAAVPDAGATDGVDAVAAVQYSDGAKMLAALAKYQADPDNDPIGYTTVKGYVLISDTQAHAEAAKAAGGTASLGAAASFRADVNALHGDQVAIGWVDIGAAARLASGGLDSVSSLAGASTGRVVLGLHADGSYLELNGAIRGQADVPKAPTATALTSLPAGTTAAIEVTGLGDRLTTTWNNLPNDQRRAVQPFVAEFGLALPGDLATLLGTDLTASVTVSGSQLHGALQVASPDPAQAVKLVKSLIADLGSGQTPPISVSATATGYIASDDPGFAASVPAAPAQSLGAVAKFRSAVPNASGASALGYVDVAALLTAPGLDYSAKDRQTLEHVAAIGFSVNPTADGTSFDVRVVTK